MDFLVKTASIHMTSEITKIPLSFNIHQQSGDVVSRPGRTTGTHLYLDMAQDHLHELYLAQIESTRPVFALAAIAGNHALRQVQVEHSVQQGAGHHRVGDVLLAEVKFMPGRPSQAKAPWSLTARPVQQTPQPRPAPQPILQPRPQALPAVAPRYHGTLMELHGNTGYLIEECSGERVLIHRHQLITESQVVHIPNPTVKAMIS